MSRRIAFAIAFSLSWSPLAAQAQRAVDARVFRPSVDSFGIITIERSQTSHQYDFGFKVWSDYAHNPLKLSMFDTSTNVVRRQNLMTWQAVVHLGVHFGITNWLQVSADMPVSAQGWSSAYGKYGSAADKPTDRTGFYAADPYTNVPPPTAAPLDARLALKARLLRKGTFGLGLLAAATLPFGDEAAFLGDRTFTFRPTLIGDFTRGPLTVALNVGAIVRQHSVVYDPNDQAMLVTNPRVLVEAWHELTYGLGFAYRFVHWVGAAAEFYGVEPLLQGSSPGAAKDRSAEVLAGLQFFPANQVALTFGAGANVISDARRHDDFRVFLGLNWAPALERGGGLGGGIDTDHDTVPDGQDTCPNEAEDLDNFRDDDGCPEPDNDGDGFLDTQDKCPNEAEDRDGYEDNDGCAEPDNDGDGVADAQDKCPNDREDLDGYQDDDGCPEGDNDGDGIADTVDRCPNEPETPNGIDDRDGCPDGGGAAARAKLDLPEVLVFEANKTSPDAKAVAALADRIKSSGAQRIRIEGHADKGERNAKQVAQSRAESVREALIARGVEPERLQAVGYGDARPLDRANAAKNRRVEFIVVEQ